MLPAARVHFRKQLSQRQTPPLQFRSFLRSFGFTRLPTGSLSVVRRRSTLSQLSLYTLIRNCSIRIIYTLNVNIESACPYKPYSCQCEPSRPLRCPRGARKAEENYINSVFLQSLPEAKRRKVFGDRDPCRDLKMVLISLYILSTRNNARFNTEKTKSGQRHIFDEMH
ncbi:hypothetical protein RP20_CCG003472 [Aedes albopictus]|nr:hypothetical protein RP20_CCG003472 [Aedes albopictus]